VDVGKELLATPVKYAPVRFSEPTLVKYAALSFGIERGTAGRARVNADGKRQTSEVGGRMSEVRCQRSEVGDQRPERPEFIQELEKQIPYYGIRHSVRPGITGWAQVNYRYGASVEDALRKLEYDLYYIKNMSLFLDLKIILKTIGVVLFGQGAR